MNALTKDQQIENCIVALARWAKVKPESVDLDVWRCGTHACFGGHLTTWQEFKDQGVRRATSKAPVCIVEGKRLDGKSVADYLFGDGDLFSSRGYGNLPQEYRLVAYDEPSLSDHELVIHRLERQIEVLSS